MKYRLKWFYYLLFRRHREKITPRATWAQLLMLLNVDSKTIGKSRLVGADCIPSTLDVPVQKFKLTDLGVFAFCLGFNEVEISTKERTISAAGPMGTITTESLPGYGAVARFQVLSPRLRHFVTIYHPMYDLIYHRSQVMGSFIFPKETIEIMLPMQYNLLRRQLDFHGTALYAGCPTVADEARHWRDVEREVPVSEISKTNPFPPRLAAWQARQNDEFAGGTRRWPTVLLAASAACLPGTSMGFPSSVLLGPFLDVFQQMARPLFSISATWDRLDDLGEDTVLAHLLQGDFGRFLGHRDLIRYDGHFSWAFNNSGPIELEQVEKILRSRIPPTVVLFQNNAVSDPDSQPTSLLEGRLLPYTVGLFTCFNPLLWAGAVRSQRLPKEVEAASLEQVFDSHVQGWRNHVEASSILWTQTFLLDIAICNIIYQYVNVGRDAFNGVKKALVDCWEDPEAESPLQDLDKFLSRKFFPEKGTGEQAEKMRVLANMIKMRTLCYIAYMMVIPDSTSLYEASLQHPVMLPMI